MVRSWPSVPSVEWDGLYQTSAGGVPIDDITSIAYGVLIIVFGVAIARSGVGSKNEITLGLGVSHRRVVEGQAVTPIVVPASGGPYLRYTAAFTVSPSRCLLRDTGTPHRAAS